MHCWSGGRLGAGAGKSPQQLLLLSCTAGRMAAAEMTPVGFEPMQLALVELESTPLDHSGKVSLGTESARKPTHDVQHGAVAGLVPLPICGAGAARLRHVPERST